MTRMARLVITAPAGAVTSRGKSVREPDRGRGAERGNSAMDEKRDGAVIMELFEVVEQRKGGDPKTSYVARTVARGTEHVAKKVGEEGVEVALAGLSGDRARVVSESADLLFHLCLLWSETGVEPGDVFAELSSRRGRSGLARDERKQAAGGRG